MIDEIFQDSTKVDGNFSISTRGSCISSALVCRGQPVHGYLGSA